MPQTTRCLYWRSLIITWLFFHSLNLMCLMKASRVLAIFCLSGLWTWFINIINQSYILYDDQIIQVPLDCIITENRRINKDLGQHCEYALLYIPNALKLFLIPFPNRYGEKAFVISAAEYNIHETVLISSNKDPIFGTAVVTGAVIW